jgi:prophage regulatory protein
MAKLLRIAATAARVGNCRSIVYVRVKDGLFPKPVRIGPNSVAWPDYEIDALIRARVAGKSDEDIRALVRELEAKRAEVA